MVIETKGDTLVFYTTISCVLGGFFWGLQRYWIFNCSIIDAEGRTYLFDLDFNMGDQNPYTVDAAFFGNVSHFINHR